MIRNKALLGLVILLTTNILLVAYSFYYSRYNDFFINHNVRFITIEKLFDFSSNLPNRKADSLLEAYISNTVDNSKILKRTPLSKIAPKKQNIFLQNPITEDGYALDNFFKSLLYEKDTTVIRIAHYGDSQLEGDRMSYVIRQKFHEKFGGSGIGYVPLKDLSPVSYIRKSSGNWARYTVFHDKYYNNYYGLSGTVCRFSKYAVYQDDDKEDSLANNSQEKILKNNTFYYNASVVVKMSEQYKYKTVSVMYGRSKEMCQVKCYDMNANTLLHTDTLHSCENVCLKKMPLPSCLHIKIEFTADQSPDFYGLYFDDVNGVQVDNYAIRGHSGDGLLLIPDEHLSAMLKMTNTRLIIFQFGANVVPYINSQKVCDAIGEMYYNIFTKFKKAAKDISILVIGAGDMARGGEGGYVSYKWLPQINQMQKNAALKAGCAYWDLFNMMGGSNSILAWTSKNLAVANGHFTAKGQEIVANEIVEALMIEYNNFIYRNRKNKLNASR